MHLSTSSPIVSPMP